MANQSAYPKADIVVLTVLPEEFQAVANCLENPRFLPGTDEEPNVHAWHVGTLHSTLYDLPFTVIFGKGMPTNNYAAVATMVAIGNFSPRYIVFVGVAGGLKKTSGQHQGDVVVSSFICAYEYGKIDTPGQESEHKNVRPDEQRQSSGFRPRSDLSTMADLGLARAADVAIAKKDKWWRDDENPDRVPAAETGHVGSGDKVIDDPSDPFFEQVLQVWPKLLAVEMEGAGVGAAIQEAHALGRKVGFLLVRGLSDLPHKKKRGEPASTGERDNWKPLASTNAARFFCHLVNTLWPVPPRSKASDSDHVADTTRLRGLMTASLAQVPNALGANIRIPRPEAIGAIEGALATSTGLAFIGPSGTGKSALLRGLVEARLEDDTEALWFDAEIFCRTDYLQLEAQLNLRHPLGEYANRSRSPLPLIVIDGLDRQVDMRVFRGVAALIANFRPPWKIAVACQSEQWERVQLALLAAGVATNAWRVQQCAPLDPNERSVVAATLPRVAFLLNDERLAPIVSNLKVLDLVVRKLLVGENVPSAEWVGESSVALWYWESYIRNGARAALRARIVARVAERQAETTSSPPTESELSSDELVVIDELETDRILRRGPGGSLSFEHDLIGDWIRFQAIVSRPGDLAAFLATCLARSGWHRAIRLYGVYLLEHQRSVVEWSAVCTSLANAHGDSAGDLILEAVVYATYADPLLRLVEPVLLLEDGRLLRRLLNRFLSFCTVPDPQMMELARTANIERDHVEHIYRVPNATYWPPILNFVCDEQHKLLPIAPIELSKIADLWLGYGAPSLLRQRVAELAIALGSFGLGLEDSYKSEDREQRQMCYRAALKAAADRPELATRFVLRAARRDRPTDSQQPDDGDLGDCEIVSSPYGPYTRIDDEFREIILDASAFEPFVAALPAVAREVALAVLLREPHHPPQFDPIDPDFGFAYRQWKSSTFLDGSFLVLLRYDFDEGLALITTLVDIATERLRKYHEERFELRGWYGSPPRPDDSTPEQIWTAHIIRMDIGGTIREFAGGGEAYAWAAGQGNVPDAVQAALTSLEQHLYLRAKAGALRDHLVLKILTRARSAAFLNILVNVGKLQDKLFDRTLRPLLGEIRLYSWDANVVRQGLGHMLIGLYSNDATRKIVADFVSMQHRRRSFALIARERFESVAATRAYLGERFAVWRAESKSAPFDPESVEELIAVISSDTTHFEVIPLENGGVRLISKASRADDRTPSVEAQAQERLESLLFPARARRMLNGETPSDSVDREALWTFTQERAGGWMPPVLTAESSRSIARRVWEALKRFIGRAPASGGPSQEHAAFPQQRVNVIAAALAILATFHYEWLQEDSKRMAWCRAFLRRCLEEPVTEDFNPRGAELDYWDEFAADAVASLWSRKPDDVELRDLVGELALRPRYVVTERLIRVCSKRRASYRNHFEQLLRVLVEVAQIRILARMVMHIAEMSAEDSRFDTSGFISDFERWIERVREDFIHGRTLIELAPWSDLDPARRFPSFEEWYDKLIRRQPGVDFELLQASHSWLPSFGNALDAHERSYMRWFWREGLVAMIARREDSDDTPSAHLFDSERWFLGGIGSLVSELDPDDGQQYWEPILGLEEERAYFAEQFLSQLYRRALRSDTVPGRLHEVVASIGAAAIEEDGRPRVSWARHENAWLALIGLDEFARSAWADRHTPLLRSMTPLMNRWLIRKRIYPRHLATFAQFLAGSVGKAIRAEVLRGLVSHIASDASALDEESTANAMAELLLAVLREGNALDQLAAPFQALLQMLLDRQNPMALNLYGRLGSLS